VPWRLAHAEDPADAGAKAERLRVADRLDPRVVGVGGDDLVEVRAPGLEVVVELREAGGLELLQAVAADEAEGRVDLGVAGAVDGVDGLDHEAEGA
jgi:hypothetical protein